MKFDFKKIASAASSVALIGSTVALAAAANYPAPFVDDGVANFGIVYGANANLDLPSAVNIQTSLSDAFADQGGGEGDVVIDGDAYALFTSSTPIQLNASISSVRSTVTENNLPTVLGESEFTATSDASDDASITTTFKMTVGSNRAVFAKEPTSNDDPALGILLGTTSASHLYNVTATFSKDVNFTDSDSHGNSLDLFGKRFTIASASDATNVVLFESAEKVFLDSETNPSAVVSIDGSQYTVELVSASDSAATIRLIDSDGNSESEEINEAASRKMLGVEVAVDTADETNFKLSASVILGASRIKLTDGSEVLLGTEEDVIEGTQVEFSGDPTDLRKISVAVYAADGSNDFFTAGSSFEDPVFGGFKLDFAALTGDSDREDIEVGVSGNDKMVISFTDSNGDELSNFNWLNNESSAWGTAFLGDSSDWQLFSYEMGKINESAYTVVGNEEDAYLIKLQSLSNISGTTGNSNEYTSDIVKFQNVFDTSQTWEANVDADGSGTIDIGGLQYTVTYWDDRDGDNDEYVQLNSPDSSSDMILYPSIQTDKGAKLQFYEPLVVNLSVWDGSNALVGNNFKIPDGDGYTDVAVAGVNVPNTDGGFQIASTIVNSTQTSKTATIGPYTYNFTYSAANTTKVFLLDVSGGNIANPGIVLTEEQDEDNNYNGVIIQTGGAGDSNNGIGVSDVDFTWNVDTDMSGTAYGTSGLQRESDEDLYDMMDRWGTMVTTDQSTSDQYTAIISYPDDQVTAEVYASEGSASVGGGDLGTVLFTDTQISQVQSKNLIVVGGSCINSVAASLLGSDSALCGPNWESATGVGSGSFLIETFQSPFASGKVATLVAGYEATDTANAATYLTTETVMTDAGKKYVGTSATQATLQDN